MSAEIFAILKAIEAIVGGPAMRHCIVLLRTFGPDSMCIFCGPVHSRILHNETAVALARLGSLFGGDLLVGPGTPICHLYGLANGWVGDEEQWRWENRSGCFVSRRLCIAVVSNRTDWLLGNEKVSLRLVVGFITVADGVLVQIPAGLLQGMLP